MRTFLAQRTGTGTPVLVPIDPYIDENGVTVTEAWQDDSIRPDADMTGAGPYICKPMQARGREFFFVVAADLAVRPAGTLDLGDPTDPASMDVPLTAGQRTALETYFGLAAGTLDGRTRRQVIKWCLNDMPRFAVRLRRYVTNIIRDGD